VHRGTTTSYGDLEAQRQQWLAELEARGVGAGEVVGVRSDYSPRGIALLLALLSRGNVAAMLPLAGEGEEALLREAFATHVLRAEPDGGFRFESLGPAGTHPLLERLRESGSGGFVIFSSGSTGRPKAVLHDAERFLSKFDVPGKRLRTLAFLLFDHIAGMDTLFYTLAAGGSLALPERRDPHFVCELIERHRVEVLPTSPSFLRLMLLSGAHEGRDLSSLRIVTYGSEPMDQATLSRVAATFPQAQIAQKYGTSELGSPRSRSRDRGSLWLELRDGEIETKIVDGILWLRSPAAMLGYLNAPSEVDAEGWYCTGDRVEQDGEWIRILGRESDTINVGGEKVLPQEVEEVILELDWVRDVVVKGVPHPILGQVVRAEVVLANPGGAENLRRDIRRHCLARLPRHKAPVEIVEATGPVTSVRHKKTRK
jgi:acyl-CoA synthetase (AMP-forming)/AMP-acid ligase II